MSVEVTLHLPEDLAGELSREAHQRQLTMSEYAVQLLSAARAAEPTSGAALVEYWRREGIIGSQPDIADSQAHARMLRQQAERRGGD